MPSFSSISLGVRSERVEMVSPNRHPLCGRIVGVSYELQAVFRYQGALMIRIASMTLTTLSLRSPISHESFSGLRAYAGEF